MAWHRITLVPDADVHPLETHRHQRTYICTNPNCGWYVVFGPVVDGTSDIVDAYGPIAGVTHALAEGVAVDVDVSGGGDG